MSPTSHRFELLTYYWQVGFRNFVTNMSTKGDVAVWFNTIEHAIDDVQECFDVWNMQIKDGEREWGFSTEEFRIRCVETRAFCNLGISDGKVHLKTADSRLIPQEEYERINQSGIF